MSTSTENLIQEYVTAEQLAEALQINVATIYRWAAEGRIPSYKVSHRNRRFLVEDVLAWLDTCRQGPGRAA